MWTPRLPVNRFGRTGSPVDETLFAVTATEKGTQRLLCVNDLASRRGLRAGMRLADARAVAPGLVTRSEDPRRDAAFLRALQRWAGNFSPAVACDWAPDGRPEGLFLDITGCAHLFGGEASMLARLHEGLTDRGVEVRLAIADAAAAARAAARFGREPATILAPGGVRAAVAAYPIEALGVEAKTVSTLRRLGMRRVGDLYPLKTADLARRFGFALVRAYEKLLGVAADPVAASPPPATFAARLSFPDPIGLRRDVEAAADRLAAQVCKRLETRGCGARGARLSLYRADRGEIHLEIGLARPTCAPAALLRQFAFRLDAVDVGEGLDRMRLEALSVEPHRPAQAAFAEAETPGRLDELVSTLGNRLGFDRVLRWAPCESHAPRRAYRLVEATASSSPSLPPRWPTGKVRPLMTFACEPIDILEPGRPPRVFRWRGEVYRALRVEGPERIGAEWWKGRDSDPPRDYWRVDSAQGMRFWLAAERLQPAASSVPARWTLAGVFP